MPITATHAKSNTIVDWAGVVTVGNSTGGSSTVQASNLVRPSDWNSAHAITFNLTASEAASVFNFIGGLTSTTAAGGISAAIDSAAYFEAFPLINTNSTLSAPGIGTWYLDGPYVFPWAMGSGLINALVSNAAGFLHGTSFSAASTASVSRFQTFNHQLALYSLGSGASTSRLESVWTMAISLLATQELKLATANTSSGTISNALTLSFPSQWNSTGGVVYGSTVQTGASAFGTSTAASTRADSLITGAVAYLSGARMDIFGFTTTLAPAEYWLGYMFTSTSSTAGTAGGIGTAGTLFQTHSRLGILENAVGGYRVLGKSISNSTTNVQPFHGFLATTTSQATSIINTGDMRATTGRMYWNSFVTTY